MENRFFIAPYDESSGQQNNVKPWLIPDNAFEVLNDWHLLRAIAFQRPELVEAYIHLLDLEAYDEA